jgi:hypothetical protein
MSARTFLRSRILSLAARARRLRRVDYASVGIRPQDLPYAPSPDHFRAANRRLAQIDREVVRRMRRLVGRSRTAPLQRVLIDIALVEREIDRARRSFGLFFEIFGQRGTTFAPNLAAHDAIAEDCYRAVREAAPEIFRGPLLKPVCYMEHGYSPATFRRGVALARLLGESNPFPIVRIPWDRDNPWQPVFLHEVAHNVQADLGIWQENRQAVIRRTIRTSRDIGLTRIYGRWHKEIFADLAALLLGGPAAAYGMALFLAHPTPRTLTFRPGGAHPTGFLRVLMLCEMLRRMGFGRDARRLEAAWRQLYHPQRGSRMPTRLLASANTVIPHVVDEIAFQTRRNLAHRALADVIPFRAEDEAAIKAGGRLLAEGRVPEGLPPRHLVSAAGHALSAGRIHPRRLAGLVVGHLTAQRAPRLASVPRPSEAREALAA